eukprot:TRINITY_DN3017_c0_g1_i1.p1 TRINITY_DN3017_c0_g1~~TRINITY_DN3017_c0_g1_i1.p1  ORF type:complete len:303 (+),score=128.64 TRINITY_DN3017_c0_g1_i1:36-911(+)
MALDHLIATGDIKRGIAAALVVGFSFLAVHARFSASAPPEGPVHRLFVELRRKSFHMIGGGLLSATYCWGLESEWLSPAYLAHRGDPAADGPLDAGAAFLALSFTAWLWDAARLTVPALRRWYLASFEGLVRQKEFDRAAGIAYFLPGALAAMLAGPPNVAILGILYLSIGDAAASLGTAVGRIPVGVSNRKFEGTVGCFLVCWAVGALVGLDTYMAVVPAAVVSLGEVLAEVIGLDDNLVLPMLGVLGLRLALAPRFPELLTVMVVGFALSVSLGLLVVAGRPKPRPKDP